MKKLLLVMLVMVLFASCEGYVSPGEFMGFLGYPIRLKVEYPEEWILHFDLYKMELQEMEIISEESRDGMYVYGDMVAGDVTINVTAAVYINTHEDHLTYLGRVQAYTTYDVDNQEQIVIITREDLRD